MAVYLIHCSAPVAPPRPARHYLGFVHGTGAAGLRAVARRLERHRRGDGGRMLRACNLRGIRYDVVRTWPDGDQALENRLKRGKNHPQLCPECRVRAGLPGW